MKTNLSPLVLAVLALPFCFGISTAFAAGSLFGRGSRASSHSCSASYITYRMQQAGIIGRDLSECPSAGGANSLAELSMIGAIDQTFSEDNSSFKKLEEYEFDYENCRSYGDFIKIIKRHGCRETR